MFSNKTVFDAARKVRVDGKNVLITGANTGIGLETAREFAHRGANLTILCRNKDRMDKAGSQSFVKFRQNGSNKPFFASFCKITVFLT